MNKRYVLRQLGVLYGVLGVVMALVAGLALVDRWQQADDGVLAGPGLVALLVGAGLALVVGNGLLWFFNWGLQDRHFGRREALLLVALGWLGGAALAGVPFWVWARLGLPAGAEHPFQSAISCYFEAMSGLTTTGSTVLAQVEAVPRCLLLWRGMTQWIGGLGIVVLFVAVLSRLGAGSRRLLQFESSGRVGYDVMPQIAQTARMLWLIYLVLTVAEFGLLLACGLGWFEALSESFGTMSSGGFSTRTASTAAYASLAVDGVIVLFMVLTGVNYGLYLQLLSGRWRQVWRDPELRAYLAIVAVGFAIIAWTLLRSDRPIVTTTGEVVPSTVGSTLRHAGFQTVSLHSSTGFVTANYDEWPFLAKATILALMFIGASAGSTGGGLKVMRVLIAAKVVIGQVERIFRPNVVRVIKVGGHTVEPQMRLDVMVYIFTFIGLVVVGSVLLMAIEPDGSMSYETAFTACAATINTTGPGFGRVGALMNYGWLSDPSKILLSLLMVLGRLEIYAILVLLSPSYWRED